MQLPAIVEPLKDRSGYLARLAVPFDVSAAGESPEAALRGLTAAIERLLADGVRFATITLPGGHSPPAPGWLPDDDLTKEWRQAIEEYRKERDVEEKRRILAEPADAEEAS